MPNSLTHLTFGWEFNKLVDNLPNSLTHLTFGYGFNNGDILSDNFLFNLTNLQELTLSSNYTQPLPKYLYRDNLKIIYDKIIIPTI